MRRKQPRNQPTNAILRAIRDERKKWLEDNTEAIRYADEHLAKHGLFSDDWREF